MMAVATSSLVINVPLRLCPVDDVDDYENDHSYLGEQVKFLTAGE